MAAAYPPSYVALYESRKLARAEPLLQRALAIREKALGSEHPDVARTLNSLAGLYRTQGGGMDKLLWRFYPPRGNPRLPLRTLNYEKL